MNKYKASNLCIEYDFVFMMMSLCYCNLDSILWNQLNKRGGPSPYIENTTADNFLILRKLQNIRLSAYSLNYKIDKCYKIGLSGWPSKLFLRIKILCV